jgi:arylsulfatase A-like enzyme
MARAGGPTTALVEFIDIVPTVLELCGREIPSRVQGRSLAGLLAGRTEAHRREVFIEYAPNEEAAIRDDRWKLVWQRGRTRRTDGYDTGNPPPGPTTRLYDLERDPSELHNVALDSANAARVKAMLARLAEHLRATARQPELVPKSDDPLAILDLCVQPRDVAAP